MASAAASSLRNIEYLPVSRSSLFDWPTPERHVDAIAIGVMHPGLRLEWPVLEVGGGAQLLAKRFQRFDIIHDETEVVEPGLVVGSLLDERQIDVPVGQVDRRSVTFDLFHAECLGVEFDQSLPILGDDSQVTNARHKRSPFRI